MARKPYPNVLNNLLKALRLKYIGKRSVTKVAESITEFPAYVTKIESGEISKPSKDVLPKLINLYTPWGGWAEPITLLHEAVDSGALSNDPPFKFTALKASLIAKIPITCRALSSQSSLTLDMPNHAINRRAYTIVSFDRFLKASSTDDFYKGLIGVLPMCKSTSGFTWPHLNYFDNCADITCFGDILLVGDWNGRTLVTAEPSVLDVWLSIFDKMTELCLSEETLRHYEYRQSMYEFPAAPDCPLIDVPPALVRELPD